MLRPVTLPHFELGDSTPQLGRLSVSHSPHGDGVDIKVFGSARLNLPFRRLHVDKLTQLSNSRMLDASWHGYFALGKVKNRDLKLSVKFESSKSIALFAPRLGLRYLILAF